MSKRRKYSEEFKRDAVLLTNQPGAMVSRIARDIGVGAGCWEGGGAARVKKERDFLRDAAAFFARESS